jgi:arylsulfatase A
MSTGRTILTVLAAWVLALASSHCASRQAAEAKPPNIVFILIDDLGWADVGCFGSKYYQTPNIDRLAAQGMRFTDAYAACAVCSPTRASIMTGKYPARLHLTDWIPGEGDAQ